jgi:hypothetical protein
MRAILEAICADHAVHDGPKCDAQTGEFRRDKRTGEVQRTDSLDGKIEGLAEKGLLTSGQARRFHEHRFIGNKALHELEVPSREMLEIALKQLEHLMADLYSMPAHTARLQNVRLTAPGPPPVEG